MFLLCMKPTPFKICFMNSIASFSERFSFSAMKSNSSPPLILHREMREARETGMRKHNEQEVNRARRERGSKREGERKRGR